jgi:hypoxanthine phosphoribosyltransferase
MAQQVRDEADCLYSQAEVCVALDRMADQITARLRTANPLVLCVVNGGVIVCGALLERLDFPLRQDYLHATRYRSGTSGHSVEWLRQPKAALAGETVLVVDDILDEGWTLSAILEHCRAQGAREVLAAVLVNKQHDRKAPGARADFIGLQAPDRYLFGYGMDYHEYWRNAPGIFAVKGM